MGFKALKLNKHIVKAVSEKNYTLPTAVQLQTIPLVLDGNDVIVTAQTGTGKTAAFALPILQMLFDKQEASKAGRKIRALIISPTRELALQIEANFKLYGTYTKLKTGIVHGGTTIDPQKAMLKNGVDILIATPGRLLDLFKQQALKLDNVETLVLDEADLMLDMGFIEDVQKIEKICPPRKQVLLFSATMPNKVVKLAKTILKEPETINITPSAMTASNVEQILYYLPIGKKMQLILHLFRNGLIKGNVIVFRRTKHGVEKLEELLKENNYQVESLHGAKSQNLRQESLKTFKGISEKSHNELNILIATDVASRGIDIDGVDVVINFDVPSIPETYVHRIGRTARAGNKGVAYSFCSAEEKEYLTSIQNLIRESIKVENDHPFPLDPDAQPQIHKRKSGSKYRKGRKSEASKKKKKRWY
jgi:ATP-dependent RNA helicase RhlE